MTIIERAKRSREATRANREAVLRAAQPEPAKVPTHGPWAEHASGCHCNVCR